MSDDQWIGLLTEMQALARAGIPLDAGLHSVASDFRGKVGGEARRIADGLQEGKSLPEMMATMGYRTAPAYASIVEAGIRSGRLPEALQASIESSTAAAELRRRLVVALAYPTMVVIFTCGLLCLFGMFLAPITLEFIHGMRIGGGFMPRSLSLAEWFGPIFAGVAGLAFVAFVAVTLGFNPDWLVGWLPGLRRWPELVRIANFTELLQLMVEHRQPLPLSLRLAAKASKSSPMIRAVEEVAAACETGQNLKLGTASPRALPASIYLLLSGSLDAGRLSAGLKRLAEGYRMQIADMLDSARTRLPAVCMTLFAGSAVMVYGLSQFMPLTAMLRRLGNGG